MFVANIYDNRWYPHVFAAVPRGALAHSLGTPSRRGGMIENTDWNPSSLAPKPITWSEAILLGASHPVTLTLLGKRLIHSAGV